MKNGMLSKVVVRVAVDGWEILALTSHFTDRERAEKFAADMRDVIAAVGRLALHAHGGMEEAHVTPAEPPAAYLP